MKILIILLLLCAPVFAQKIERDVVVTLIDRARAIEIFRGAAVQSGDFALYKEGDSVTGKVAVMLRREVFASPGANREALKDALIMGLGLAPQRIAAADCSHGVSRGQDCTVHANVGK